MRRCGLLPYDYLLVAGFSLVLFGYSMIGGRPLTMHEGVLPQSAREMLAQGEWIVPTSGGRPWLERPPLPQWITMAVVSTLGNVDQVWVYRIAPALLATGVVVMVAMLAAGWFGRGMGVLAGLSLATMSELTRYAWLAEQDIFLCAVVTAAVFAFAYIEFFSTSAGKPAGELAPSETGFVSRRPWPVLALFVLLGMTNLAKGLLFGTAMAVIPMAGFLLWNADLQRIRRYVWLWGWLTYAAISVVWPLAAYMRHPDVVDLWLFDHVGRLSGSYTAINEPFWYYLVKLPEAMLPWTPLALFGLYHVYRGAVNRRYSPERFLVCWAILPPLVFSFAQGKHHHYLLQCIAPWGVLAAIGMRELYVWMRQRRPASEKANPVPAVAVVFATTAALYMAGYSLIAAPTDQCRYDTEFLHQARARAFAEPLPVIANADLQSMDIFRILFYLGDEAIPVHNLTFLRDERITEQEVWVVTRAKDEPLLRFLGTPTSVLRSEKTRRETSPEDRLTLFRLRFHPDMVRLASKVSVSPMQAMDRAEGPFLGGQLR